MNETFKRRRNLFHRYVFSALVRPHNPRGDFEVLFAFQLIKYEFKNFALRVALVNVSQFGHILTLHLLLKFCLIFNQFRPDKLYLRPTILFDDTFLRFISMTSAMALTTNQNSCNTFSVVYRSFRVGA